MPHSTFMANGLSSKRVLIPAAGILLLILCGVSLLFVSDAGRLKVLEYYDLLNDRERIKDMVTAGGWAAPLLLIGLHISQVLLAPVPGDAFCVLGGYLFGALSGFLLSTIGMTLGSIVNFYAGRLLGERLVRRVVKAETHQKYNALIRRKGLPVLFLCFLVPGFPKDMLCLLLGLSTLPVRVFIVLSMLARMPTTAVFSLQGAAFFSRDYTLFATLGGLCLVAAAAAHLARNPIRRWLDRQYRQASAR